MDRENEKRNSSGFGDRDNNPAQMPGTKSVPTYANDPLFEVHWLNEGGMKKAEDIARTFNRALWELKAICPAGREFAILCTKLEEAAFFAKKSMAKEISNQQGYQGAGGSMEQGQAKTGTGR